MEEQNILGKRIRELRLAKGLTQREVSEQLIITATSISAYEKGIKTPTIETIRKIAEAFSVSTDWLIGLADEKQKQEINTYADIIKLLISLDFALGEKIKVREGSIHLEDNKGYEVENVLYFNNDVMSTFMQEWKKIRDLYYDKTIDKELYEAWIEKKVREFKDKTIV